MCDFVYEWDDQLEDFYAAFNGKENIIGTNVSYLEKTVKKLKEDPRANKSKIIECYSELGKDVKGNKKPKTCWKFVKNGSCNHCKTNDNVHGKVFGNLWHPGIKEREYLKKQNHM